jgi:uncharacterized repeat protein (TIGR02543 family)
MSAAFGVTVSDYVTAVRATDNRSGVYRYGEELDLTVVYDTASGLTDQTAEDYTVNNYGKTTLGEQSVTVTYGGVASAAFGVTVNPNTVALNVNGGAYADGYTAPASYTYADGATLPAAPQISKYGYLFAGWYEDAELTGDPVTEIAAGSTGDKAYWAKWDPIVFTVTVQYGDGKATEIGVPFGGTVSQTQALEGISVPDGYKFDGLYLDKAYTAAYDGSESATGDFTLYVKWEPIEADATGGGALVPILAGVGAAVVAGGIALAVVLTVRKKKRG